MSGQTPSFDIIIAGAGIVGLASAWRLINKQPDLKIAVLEKEQKSAVHQSSRNSGVIHSGVYYEAGSAKAENCLRGYAMLLDFAKEHNIPFQITGKLIAAAEESEIPVLEQIHQRGIQNGLRGLDILDEKACKKAEPNLRAVQAIWVPQTGIIDYGYVCEVLVSLLQERGVSVYFDHAVTDFREELHDAVISTHYGDFFARLFLNCCGLYADKVAVLTGMAGAFRIMPFRGEFYHLSPEAQRLIQHMVYPVPDPRFPFLGVHFTPRLDGRMEAGPNAVMAFAREGYRFSDVHVGELAEILLYSGFYRMAFRYWKKGMDEMKKSISPAAFLKSAQHLLPALKQGDLVRSRSGVRAQCVSPAGKLIYDYLILENERVINLVNAPSPAATSALSIGEFLAEKSLARLQS